ncbi:MAG: hypothetical protein QF464_16170, partial [Myxococcota bacterium]|nr:hypothetical protein [Myxococcota bacterium]
LPAGHQGTSDAGGAGRLSDSAPDIEAALASLDVTQLDAFEFIINADGSVTFIDFPPELLDIAFALNPDDPLVCERRELLGADGGQTT